MQTVNILGVDFAHISAGAAVDLLQSRVRGGVGSYVVTTPNPEAVMQAGRNADFAQALRSADLSLADGIGIIIAARMLKTPLPQRVRGVDTIFSLFARLNADGVFSVYFLGGAQGVAAAAAEKMQLRYTNLRCTGHHHGFFDADASAAIIRQISDAQPDILLVCTGMPRAEIWAAAHRHLPARLIMCLGGSIDIMAGTAQLAPGFMRKIGLEWLYRLARQPWRIRRMMDLPRFMLAVLRLRCKRSQRGTS